MLPIKFNQKINNIPDLVSNTILLGGCTSIHIKQILFDSDIADNFSDGITIFIQSGIFKHNIQLVNFKSPNHFENAKVVIIDRRYEVSGENAVISIDSRNPFRFGLTIDCY